MTTKTPEMKVCTHIANHHSIYPDDPTFSWKRPDGTREYLCDHCAAESGYCTSCFAYTGKDMTVPDDQQTVDIEQRGNMTVMSFGTVEVCDKCAGITSDDNLHTLPTRHECPECEGSGVVVEEYERLSDGGFAYEDEVMCRACYGYGTTFPRLAEFLKFYGRLVVLNDDEKPEFIATVSGEYDCEVYADGEFHRLRVSEVDQCWYYDIYPEPGTREHGTALHSEMGEFEPCQLIDFGIFLTKFNLLDETRLPKGS